MTRALPPIPSLTPAAVRVYHVLLRTVAEDENAYATRAFPSVSDARAGEDVASFGALVDAGLVEHDADSGLVSAVLPLVAQQPWTLVFLDANERLSRFVSGVADGFALPLLLDRRVRVHDWCPTCEEPVTVLFDPGRIRRRVPRSAVVVRVPSDQSRSGRYAMARLACSPGHALAALPASSNPDAVIQSIEALFVEARERYAAVMVDGSPTP